jgi:hypothetical protein
MSRRAGMRESDVQLPFISTANAVEMSAHPCAELVGYRNRPIPDSNYLASIMAVMPMPPAVHTEINPRPLPFCCSNFAIVATILAPVAANG